jgi:homoserine kinase type II
MHDSPSDTDASTVLDRYWQLGCPLRLESLRGAGGFSGSLIWRVTAAAGQRRYCLRRWPAEGPDLARLHWIHAVLVHVGGSPSNSLSPWERGEVSPPLNFIPVPLVTDPSHGASTIVEHAGYFWELAPWLPGEANYAAHPSPARLAAALQALARFHATAASFSRPTCAPAPAILERAARLAELQHSQYERIARAVRQLPVSPLVECGNHLLDWFPLLAPQLAVALAAAASIAVPLQVAIRDVWHDHILFTGDEVTGLVDFGAMRIDTPLTDIARLVGSLAADDVSQRNHAFAAYHALRPLSDEDRWLINLLDHSGQLLAGLNWLDWLFLDRRQFDNPAAILALLHQILARLYVGQASRLLY